MDEFSYLRFVASLLLVLGLIVACLWAIRRFGLSGSILGAGQRRRLRIIETLPVDAKNRLVLVRLDDREHLLLIGASSSAIVERDIVPPLAGPGGPGHE